MFLHEKTIKRVFYRNYGIVYDLLNCNIYPPVVYYFRLLSVIQVGFHLSFKFSGCSVVRLSRLLWEQEVPSSNLGIPTKNPNFSSPQKTLVTKLVTKNSPFLASSTFERKSICFYRKVTKEVITSITRMKFRNKKSSIVLIKRLINGFV
jgi:hypothetical protein